MPSAEIEEFLRILIRDVRDNAISSCDSDLRSEAKGPVAVRWRKKLQTQSCEALATEMIPDCVDETLANLLHAIDQGTLRLLFVASNGKVVDLTDEGMGELTGWYMGGELVSKYSHQRFVDDFGDLRRSFHDRPPEFGLGGTPPTGP